MYVCKHEVMYNWTLLSGKCITHCSSFHHILSKITITQIFHSKIIRTLDTTHGWLLGMLMEYNLHTFPYNSIKYSSPSSFEAPPIGSPSDQARILMYWDSNILENCPLPQERPFLTYSITFSFQRPDVIRGGLLYH